MNDNGKTVTIDIASPEETQVITIIAQKPRLKEPYIRLFTEELLKVVQDKDIKLDSHRVLGLILAMMEYENLLTLTQDEIAALLGMKRPNVSRAVKQLVEKGYLEIRGKVGRQNAYAVNPYLAFKTRAKNVRYLQSCWVEGTTPDTRKPAIQAVEIETSEYTPTPLEVLSQKHDIPTEKLQALIEDLLGKDGQ